MIVRTSLLLNPSSVWSIANTLMLFDFPFVLVYVRFQQLPQLAEFHPAMASAPPM